jgi:hypothetical protein
MESSGYLGFGVRRKRNINFKCNEQHPNQEILGIQWQDSAPSTLQKEREVVEEWETETHQDEEHLTSNNGNKSASPHTNRQSPFILDGKPFSPRTFKKKKAFSETHVRFTSYLERDLYHVVQLLKNQGYIESITELINDSIKDYLLRQQEK